MYRENFQSSFFFVAFFYFEVKLDFDISHSLAISTIMIILLLLIIIINISLIWAISSLTKALLPRVPSKSPQLFSRMTTFIEYFSVVTCIFSHQTQLYSYFKQAMLTMYLNGFIRIDATRKLYFHTLLYLAGKVSLRLIKITNACCGSGICVRVSLCFAYFHLRT